MADYIVNLDFIPVDLDGNPVMRETIAKTVGRLLCASREDTENCLARYQLGKQLFNTGSANLGVAGEPQTLGTIAYFKDITNKYKSFSNEVKGQILEKFL